MANIEKNIESPHESPHDSDGVDTPWSSTYIKPQARKPHDSNVTFEEYHHYAHITREEQRHLQAPTLNWLKFLFGKRDPNPAGADDHSNSFSQEKFVDEASRIRISDEEWKNASRAFRTAGWGACFYLITADILGPYGVGYAIGTMGWGPGIGLFTVFGFMGGYSGYLIWKVFMGVDSYEFPAKNYGDLGHRSWGTITRHVTNFMQALALLLILGQVVIQYGENISSMSKYKLCFVVCPVIFVCIGFFLTQIRTLKSYGWLANLSLWLTLLSLFITMGVIANEKPHYQVSVLGSAGQTVNPATVEKMHGHWPKIIHYSGIPTNGLIGAINGLLNGVLAYAGAQLFVEFMAEMRRPRDFLKAMWGAQAVIYTCYIVYGSFVYYYQGQYSFQPSYLGVRSYAWRTVGNVITLIAALIAAGLYGNIGIKVFYQNVLVDLFRVPPLITRRGKIFYACIVPIWWSLAFVIAAAIPAYPYFVSIISASCLLNMTYTLPPFFALGYDIQRHSIRKEQGEGFDAKTGEVIRQSGIKRWIRGFLSGGIFQVLMNVWHATYFLASLSMCGLGMYAAIKGMIGAFEGTTVSSFTCTSPLNLHPNH